MTEAVEQTIEEASEEVEIPVNPNGATDPAPAPETKPIVVDEVDRLKAENLNLKLITLVNRETILQQQMTDIQNQRTKMQQEMYAMRQVLQEKYGINLTTHHIRPEDGVVIPRPQQG